MLDNIKLNVKKTTLVGHSTLLAVRLCAFCCASSRCSPLENNSNPYFGNTQSRYFNWEVLPPLRIKFRLKNRSRRWIFRTKRHCIAQHECSPSLRGAFHPLRVSDYGIDYFLGKCRNPASHITKWRQTNTQICAKFTTHLLCLIARARCLDKTEAFPRQCTYANSFIVCKPRLNILQLTHIDHVLWPVFAKHSVHFRRAASIRDIHIYVNNK